MIVNIMIIVLIVKIFTKNLFCIILIENNFSCDFFWYNGMNEKNL